MKTLSWISLVLFVLSLVTGVLVHVAGHVWSHQVWHNLSVVHIIFNVFFLGTYITHIVRHRKWYPLVVKKFDKISNVTLLLNITSLITIFTGVALLLFADGQGTHLGLVHYIIGVTFGVFCIWHVFMRFKPFKKKRKK